MPKIYVDEATWANPNQLQEIIEKIMQQNYESGNAKEAAKKIIKLFVVKENSLKNFKK